MQNPATQAFNLFMAQFGAQLDSYLSLTSDRKMSTPTLNKKLAIVTRIKESSSALADKAKPTLNNGSLSDVGKRERIRELINAELVTFKWLGEISRDNDGEIRSYQNKFFQPTRPASANEIVSELREGELRQHFRNLDQKSRDAEYLEAASRDDLDTILAFDKAPGRPLIGTEVRERALSQRAERLFPAQYAGYQQVLLLREFLHAISLHVARVLHQYQADPDKLAETFNLKREEIDPEPKVENRKVAV